MKGRKIQVADDPETQRHLKNASVVSNVTYHGDIERREQMEKIRPPLEETANKGTQKGKGTVHSAADAITKSLRIAITKASKKKPNASHQKPMFAFTLRRNPVEGLAVVAIVGL